MNSTTSNDKTDLLEREIWQALNLDDLEDEMMTGGLGQRDAANMGTGATHNACYHCSNSATTAGCGTCG